MVKSMSNLLGFTLVLILSAAVPAIPNGLELLPPPNGLHPGDEAKTCTVTAGKTLGTGTLTLGGSLGVTAQDFAGATEVKAKITADLLTPLEFTWPVNAQTFKKGVFNNSQTIGTTQTMFKLDTKTKKFSLSLKNANLRGLGCPFEVEIIIGAYSAPFELDETLVNGKNPSPDFLLMGVLNRLTVDKFQVKTGTKVNTDTLTVSGKFSIDGSYDSGISLNIQLGAQNFEVPAGSLNFNNTKNVLTCTNAAAAEGTVSVKFDLNLGTYTVTVKNTAISGFGSVGFAVDFPGVGLLGPVLIDLGPQKTFSLMDELLLYNTPTPNAYWQYDAIEGGDHYVYTNQAMGPADVDGDQCFKNAWDYQRGLSEDYYWLTDDSGVSLRKISIMEPDFEMNVQGRLWYAPALIGIGQTHTATAPVTGTIWVVTDDAVVTGNNLAGTTTISGKVVKWESVTTPKGTFQVVRIQYTLTLKATADVEVEISASGEIKQARGTLQYSKTETLWCLPGGGIVKGQSSDSTRMSALGKTITDKSSDTYSLESSTEIP
jgi:hypothetical protein